MTLRFFQGHFHSEPEAFAKAFFQQHRKRHCNDVSSHLFSQGLKLIWVKTAWLYLYSFKSYNRLQVATWDETPGINWDSSYLIDRCTCKNGKNSNNDGNTKSFTVLNFNSFLAKELHINCTFYNYIFDVSINSSINFIVHIICCGAQNVAEKTESRQLCFAIHHIIIWSSWFIAIGNRIFHFVFIKWS